MEQHIFIAIGLALISTLIALFPLRCFAPMLRLVDVPGGRKQHLQTTPVVGGIAMYIGLVMGLLALPVPLFTHISLLITCLLILAVGVLDDLHDISPRVRILIQLIALGMMIFWGQVVLEHLGPLLGAGSLHLRLLAVPVTLFGAATLINAVNMLDGLDGLAGSIALLAFLSLAGIAARSGLTAEASVLAVMAAAVMGFLCFNFPFWPNKQATLFMGDAGSTLLGLFLAWYTIALSQHPQSVASPAIMLWVVMVPIMDLAVVFTKRLKRGQSPFKPSSDHIQDALLHRGLSRSQAAWLIAGMGLLGQGVAWLMIYWHLPDAMVFTAFLLTFAAYTYWRMRQHT